MSKANEIIRIKDDFTKKIEDVIHMFYKINIHIKMEKGF